MKRILFAIMLSGLIMGNSVVLAESPDRATMDKLNKMTPEQRDAFLKERQNKWGSMSKEEKLKVIEERRKTHIQQMDDKWKSMSDDEKIKHVEERMNRGGPAGGPGGPGGGQMPPPEDDMNR